MIPKDVAKIADLLVDHLDISRDRAIDMAWVIYEAGFRNQDVK